MKLRLSAARQRFPECKLTGCTERQYLNHLCRRHHLDQDRYQTIARIQPTGIERRAEVQITDGEMAWFVSKARWLRGQEYVGRPVVLEGHAA